jgi:hypothetical protein
MCVICDKPRSLTCAGGSSVYPATLFALSPGSVLQAAVSAVVSASAAKMKAV